MCDLPAACVQYAWCFENRAKAYIKTIASIAQKNQLFSNGEQFDNFGIGSTTQELGSDIEVSGTATGGYSISWDPLYVPTKTINYIGYPGSIDLNPYDHYYNTFGSIQCHL